MTAGICSGIWPRIRLRIRILVRRAAPVVGWMGLGAYVMLWFVVWRMPDLEERLRDYSGLAYFLMMIGALLSGIPKAAPSTVPNLGVDWTGALTVVLCGAAAMVATWVSGAPQRILEIGVIGVATAVLAAVALRFALRHKGQIGEQRFETTPPAI
ncbi:hypothetical protein WBP06_17795 [Novosphingobium sp. BL-8H]|uniref:hypothetical protein n=1 Tax=Novosphingobium sp. BL-8H TaxID=3127640 RepID=UPI003757B59F